MIRKHLLLTIRGLKKNLLYTVFVIAGLAIGIMTFLATIQWSAWHLSFDRAYSEKETIYRLTFEESREGFHRHTARVLHGKLLNQLVFSDVLPEIVSSARLTPFRKAAFKIGEETYYEDYAYTCDPLFIDIFKPKIILGDKKDLLSVSNSAILTESTARRFFGTESPLGKTFSLMHQFDVRPSVYTVVAVIKDFPENSHFKISVLTSFDDPMSYEGTAWAYLKLQKNINPEEFEKEIKTFIDSNIEKEMSLGLLPRLQPLTDIHLKSNKAREIQPNVPQRTVIVLIIAGMLVFLLAWFNYTLLSHSQNQMQIRKLMIQWQMGGDRAIFFRQFLLDNLLVGIISFVAGIALCLILMPQIESLGKTSSSANILLFSILSLLPLLIISSLLTAEISTRLLYRSLQRRFRISIKGSSQPRAGRSLFIRSIIILEFIITFVLVANLFMVARQTSFAMNKQLGSAQAETIHLHSLHRSIVDQYGLFKEKMMASSNVVMVSGSMEEPTGEAMDACEFDINGVDENDKQLFLFPVDEDFFRFYDLELLYGENIPGNYNPQDSAEFFYLNETAAKMIGGDPGSLVGNELNLHFFYPGFIWPGPIAGIVKDFHLSGMEYEISPMVIFPKYTWLYCFSIKHNGNTQELVKHLEEVWQELFPDYPLEYHFSSSLINKLYESEMDQINILMVFCIISIIIAGMGLFALSGLFMQNKVKAAALRKINGARIVQIILPELIQYLWLALLASAISIPASLLLMERWLRNYIYRTELPLWIFPICTVVLILFSWIAVFYHSIRLARINPGEFLREH